MPSPIAALTALRASRRASPTDPRRPRAEKLDADGWAVSVTYPAPLVLREIYLQPLLADDLDLFRVDGGLAARPIGADADPTPLDSSGVARDLVARLQALPEIPDAGEPYRDLRRFVEIAPPARVRAYAEETVRTLLRSRDGVPAWRPPKPKASPAPARTEAERRAASRAREVAAERASVEWYLRSLMEDEDEPLVPGDRRPAEALFESAVDALAELADAEEPIDDEDPDGLLFRAPRRRVFYAVARELFTERRDVHGARFYVIPEPTTAQEAVTDLTFTEQLADRVVDRLAERYDAEIRGFLAVGDRLGALQAQRKAFAATGTDGAAVIPFPTPSGARR